jgi:hypothetical protein
MKNKIQKDAGMTPAERLKAAIADTLIPASWCAYSTPRRRRVYSWLYSGRERCRAALEFEGFWG